ncbi:MAG TPA: sigma-70 family RNA polymerase sigma factor [Pirellulales bacterium]|jgi:RNA polymerase sigma-70 factor (ECF subfamily)
MIDDENSLAERVRAHDVAALAEYLSLKRKPLAAYVERELGTALRCKVEVDDILQEVSVEAIRSLPGVDFGDREVFSWLCQIAERRIIDAHRHFFGAKKRDAGREVPLGNAGGGSQHAGIIHLLAASMTTATQALSRGQKELHLLAALGKLSAEQREALRLRYVEGMPSKEIAARLGKTDGAIRVMLTRSLGQLQKLLDPEDAPR